MNQPDGGGRRSLMRLALLGAAVGVTGKEVGALGEPGAARLRIGDPIPELSVKTTRGDTVRLGSLRGRVLIVNFFASYCGPCRTELPILLALTTRLATEARAHAGSPWPTLLPVGIDERPEDSARFAASLGVKATVLVDPDGAVRTAFDPQRYPCTFLVDAAGVVRHINRGFGAGYPARLERWLRGLLTLPLPSP